jgi:hypothetical protein
MEKIKAINKLQYPRLNWNKTSLFNSTCSSNQHSKLMEHEYRQTLSNNCLDKETVEKNFQIDEELLRFFEQEPLCKELEVYYKCRLIQAGAFDSQIDQFIREHSNLNEFKFNNKNNRFQIEQFRNEFFELLKDYYEARLLVKKCVRHVNEFKSQCVTNQLKAIW